MFDIRALVVSLLSPATAMVEGALKEVVHSGAISMISNALGSPDFHGVRAEICAIGEKLATKIIAGLPAAETEAATDLLRMAKAIDGAMSTLDAHSASLSAMAANLTALGSAVLSLKSAPVAAVSAPSAAVDVVGDEKPGA